jgi:hypothetical protein
MNNTALTRIRKEYELIKNHSNENFTANPLKVIIKLILFLTIL